MDDVRRRELGRPRERELGDGYRPRAGINPQAPSKAGGHAVKGNPAPSHGGEP